MKSILDRLRARPSTVPSDEQGSLILDILIGIAIFALIAIIALSAVGQYRARAYVQGAPERCVWGSDWPHPTETTKPDDAILFDLLQEWVRDEPTRHRILVENPASLYGF